MGFRLKRLQAQLERELWLRPALASLFAIAMALLAYWLGGRYEGKIALKIDEESLVALLSIFASSMLSVATFTVSAIVAAASTVSTSTTYRASQYVLSDKKAQLVLSAFIAAFIYSIFSILALKAFEYGAVGRFILFLGLLLIVSFVLIAFINWVDHAMQLGRQETILTKLTEVALASINPETVHHWGARAWDGRVPPDSCAVYPQTYGYVVGLDMSRLQAKAEEMQATIILATRPGEVSEVTAAIAYISPASTATDEFITTVCTAVAIGQRREATDDLRFNLINLTETADRALSSAVNDPGTAINVLHLQLKVLAHWAEVSQQSPTTELSYQRLSVLPMTAEELVTDSFSPIARDGAGFIEVGIRLQKVLLALVRLNYPPLTQAAQHMSAVALELAEPALVAQIQRERLRGLAKQVQDLADQLQSGYE